MPYLHMFKEFLNIELPVWLFFFLNVWIVYSKSQVLLFTPEDISILFQEILTLLILLDFLVFLSNLSNLLSLIWN